MDYTITDTNLHICDSCDIWKCQFDACLDIARADMPSSGVWSRSYCSLKLEWAAHNFLYLLGIAKGRVKDVDLNVPQNIFLKAGYAILGSVGWPFIR